MKTLSSTPSDSSFRVESVSAGSVRGPVNTQQGMRRVSSAALLSGAREVEIEHNGLLYRLRHTALGKLILTK